MAPRRSTEWPDHGLRRLTSRRCNAPAPQDSSAVRVASDAGAPVHSVPSSPTTGSSVAVLEALLVAILLLVVTGRLRRRSGGSGGDASAAGGGGRSSGTTPRHKLAMWKSKRSDALQPVRGRAHREWYPQPDHLSARPASTTTSGRRTGRLGRSTTRPAPRRRRGRPTRSTKSSRKGRSTPGTPNGQNRPRKGRTPNGNKRTGRWSSWHVER